MNDFLPPDEKEQSVSRYMSFEDGENKFRILGSAITGMEYWVTVDGKRMPKRVKVGVNVPISELEENPKTGELDMPKYFWAFPVFNYADSKVQILEIKQKTIRQAIKSLIDNPKWGDPKKYDLTVTRVTEKGKTSYPSVTPDPKEDVDADILKEYKAMTINLDALYDGKDPFVSQEEHIDPSEVKI